MAKHIGKQTITFDKKIIIGGEYAIGGKDESEGPLSGCFDEFVFDDDCCKKSYELSEVDILERCYKGLLQKINLKPEDIDILIGGDLLNQLTATTFSVKPFGIPYWGVYNACATFSLGMQIGACSIEGGAMRRAIVSASSHFCTSERQYRSPLELGNQNPPTAQRTVTGSGSIFITDVGQGPYISACTTGRVIDFSQKDPYDMGTAMAPAAFDTIMAHFNATETDFSDYDAVFSGDLASIGHEIVTQMFEDQKIKVKNYYDCGCMMYDRENQYVNAGGSGAGCSATTFCGNILKRMRQKELKKILFVPTGALLSPTSQLQSQPIPSIAHAVVIEI